MRSSPIKFSAIYVASKFDQSWNLDRADRTSMNLRVRRSTLAVKYLRNSIDFYFDGLGLKKADSPACVVFSKVDECFLGAIYNPFS